MYHGITLFCLFELLHDFNFLESQIAHFLNEIGEELERVQRSDDVPLKELFLTMYLADSLGFLCHFDLEHVIHMCFVSHDL